MITDAIHDYVAGQLSGLWSLPKPQRRARLAELRRGVGHQPGDLPALWGSFLQELPKELWGRETAAGECREPSEAEWAVYLALTLYALHQQKLDYPRLAVELYRFQLPDQAANVRLQWGRDLYQMNADTPETEEKEN